MGIDDERYMLPATKGEVAGVALHASIGLRAVWLALYQMQMEGKPREETLKQLIDSAETLGERFNRLSGWSDE